jgi:hypothetical protein
VRLEVRTLGVDLLTTLEVAAVHLPPLQVVADVGAADGAASGRGTCWRRDHRRGSHARLVHTRLLVQRPATAKPLGHISFLVHFVLADRAGIMRKLRSLSLGNVLIYMARHSGHSADHRTHDFG